MERIDAVFSGLIEKKWDIVLIMVKSTCAIGGC